MKRFVLLHVGFEPPTPEVMARWKAWFAEAAPRTVQNAGLRNGREITRAGVRDLPMDIEALTGFTVIEAESMADAEKLAVANPYTTAIRIYELVGH